MPISRKKLAAKKYVKNQGRDVDSGQFIEQYSASDNEYTLSSDDSYSTDSSDENYYNQKILKLGNISFIWTGIDEKIKHYILEILLQHIIENMVLQVHTQKQLKAPYQLLNILQNKILLFLLQILLLSLLLFLLLLLKNYFPLQITIVVIVIILLVIIEKLIIFHQNLIN